MTFQSGVGCHMNNVYMRALSYADDQGWGQVQYLYLVLVLKYIFIST